MRNLVRMKNADVPVPHPLLLRNHVLLMEFCGRNGWPASKLKDCEISSSKARELYRECVVIMWTFVIHAFEFLRKDCANISEFFRKKDVATMTVKELFDFITDPTIIDDNMEECLEKIAEKNQG